jgi:nucleotide-binding universal stress UspA family protein
MSQAVVVGFDGTGDDWSTVDYAAAAADVRGAPLRIVSCATGVRAGCGAVLASYPPTAAELAVEEAVRRVGEAYPGLTVERQVSERPVAEVLRAESDRARLLVVGRHGHGVLTGLGLDSVSGRVASESDCPVVVVRGALRPPYGAPVLVGVDGHAPSQPALWLAFEEAAAHGAPVRAVSVWTSRPGDAGDEEQRRVRARLAAAVSPWRHRYPEVDVVADLVRGEDPAAALVAASGTARLLVVGPHHPEGLRGLLLGSVAGHLLRGAGCPVLVAHTAADRFAVRP